MLTNNRHENRNATVGKVQRHCIVTPDIVGPMTNGGIGTACLHLARFLKEELYHEVDILFTGETRVRSNEYWKKHYRRRFGIGYHHIDELPDPCYAPVLDPFWMLTRAQKCHPWLLSRNYSHIHFQDYHANGFVAIQAKRAALGYESTVLTVTLHSSSLWMREGNRLWPDSPVEECLLDFMENYCAEHADFAIAPSHYMLNWLRSRGHGLTNSVVVPNLAEDRAHQGRKLESIRVIAFFGRLESRKGLEIFLEAIRRLAAEIGRENMPRIILYGRPGNMSDGGDGYHHAVSFRKSTGISLTIRDSLDSQAALAELASTPDLLCVLPSLSDNLPYSVLECLRMGIPFIASNVGGVSELVASPGTLFEPTAIDLLAKLREVRSTGLDPVESRYALADVKKRFADLLHGSPVGGTEVSSRDVSAEDITVCIAHYNYGLYLPTLIKSLQAQSCPGFKVVVVDDGSSDAESVRVFSELAQEQNGDPRWIFERTANFGIGAARNRAASLSETDFLIFMDADNVAEPDMIERFVEALRNTSVDCMSCYALRFRESPVDDRIDILGSYTPVGPCIEAGLYVNVYGDANFVVAKSVFDSLGGFSTDRRSSFEDWEFLAHLTLKGFKLDVIPYPLFLYRVTPGGFSRNTSAYLNFRRILDRYIKTLPSWTAKMLEASFTTVRRSITFPPVEEASFESIIFRSGQSVRNHLEPSLRSAGKARKGNPNKPQDTKPTELLLGDEQDLSRSERELIGIISEQRERIKALESSTSWRVTAPLRWVKDLPRRSQT